MPSIINALTASGGGVAITGDATGNLALQTAGNTAVTVNTSKGVQFDNCIGVGNATPSTSGAGITFPATQSASTDANTLDDYEEGTCTFTITSGVTSPSYNIQTGWYTKIGNTVFVTGRVDITSGTTNGNTLELGGLPFTILSSSNVFPVGTCYLSVAASGANSNVIPIPIAGTTTVQFYIQNTTNIAAFSGTNFGSTGNVDFQFYYRVA